MHETASVEWVGRSVPRREDAVLIEGRGCYVADLRLPGLLEVAFVRSPIASAEIVSVDAAEAAAAPGVAAVFTGRDLRDRVSPLVLEQETPSPGLAASVDMEMTAGIIEILADDRVRYVGQPVAAVVAADRYLAEDAADLVRVEYRELPAALDPEAAREPGAPLVHDRVPGNVQVRYRVRAGDADAAFAAAPHRLRMRVRSQRVAASPMETRGVAVSCVGDEVTMWSSTQIPHIVRNSVAACLGMPQHRLRVLTPHIGGGFGCKVQVYPEEVLLAHVGRVLRVPVRWVEDRQEHLVATAHARDQIHDVEAAFDGEGRIAAIRDRFVLDSGTCCPYPLSSAYNVASHFRGMYRIPHFEIQGECVLTNKMMNVPYRGAGRPEAAFTMDRVMHEVSRRLALDPAEVIRRNLIPDDAYPYDAGMPYRDGERVVYDTGGFPDAFERLLELIGYDEHRRGGDGRAPGRLRGIGFSTYVEGTGVGPFEGATVQLDSDGRVEVYAGCAPHGQGHETTMSQIVADVFRIAPGDVVFRAGDTALVPYGVGTFASRSVVTAGAAIRLAAGKLLDRVRRVAAELLEASADDLEVAGGQVRVRGVAARSVSLRDVYRAAAPGPGARLPDGMEPGSAESDYFVPPTVTWGCGLVAADVDVDPETGVVAVRRLAIVHDCGRVINPVIVEGQIQGGLVQGVGAALYEHMPYDESGQPLASTFMDYLLPTSAEAPEIVQAHLEHPSDRNPLGVKGVGEAGTIAPPAAIANAVADALGEPAVELNELPLSPATVLAAIEARRSG